MIRFDRCLFEVLAKLSVVELRSVCDFIEHKLETVRRDLNRVLAVTDQSSTLFGQIDTLINTSNLIIEGKIGASPLLSLVRNLSPACGGIADVFQGTTDSAQLTGTVLADALYVARQIKTRAAVLQTLKNQGNDAVDELEDICGIIQIAILQVVGADPATIRGVLSKALLAAGGGSSRSLVAPIAGNVGTASVQAAGEVVSPDGSVAVVPMTQPATTTTTTPAAAATTPPPAAIPLAAGTLAPVTSPIAPTASASRANGDPDVTRFQLASDPALVAIRKNGGVELLHHHINLIEGSGIKIDLAESGDQFNITFTASGVTTSGVSGVGGSGVATRVAFWSDPTTLSSDSSLYWDNINKRLGIGTSNPQRPVHAVTSALGSTGTTVVAMDNTSTVDPTGSILSFRTTTSGVGGAAFQEVASINGVCSAHDHPVRAGRILFQTAKGDGNPASERMRLTEAGQLLIGGTVETDLSRLLTVFASDGKVNSSGHSLHVQRYGDYPVVKMIRFDGTLASPTKVSNLESLGALEYAGEDGSGTGNDGIVSVRLFGQATETWQISGVGGTGADLIFQLTPTGQHAPVSLAVLTQGSRLGLNTIAPLAKLHIVEDLATLGATSQSFFTDLYNNTNVTGPLWIARRARGSLTSPSAVITNDQIFNVGGRAYGSTAFSSGARAQITFMAAETWTDTAQGTHQGFFTTPVGSAVIAERMRLTASGLLGINATVPAAFLDVNGDIAARRINVVLANGQNDNIVLGTFTNIRFVGPTAATQITGFANGVNGKVLLVYFDVAQTFTVMNESTGSTAVARIRTLTGADIAFTGPATFVFIYDSAVSRWILVAARDASSTGAGFISGAGQAGQVAFFTSSTTIAGVNQNFWDNTNKRLGIGTITPTDPIDVVTSGVVNPTLALHAYGAALSPAVRGLTATGQPGSEGFVVSGVRMVGMEGYSWSGAGFSLVGRVSAKAQENHSASALGTMLEFDTVKQRTTVLINMMRLTASGVLQLGENMDVADRPVRLDADGGIAARRSDVVIASGIVNNLGLGNRTTMRLTGPLASFILTGFTDGCDGKFLTVHYDGTQQVTVSNENAGSTAINRIRTVTGLDQVYAGPLTLIFQYDAAVSRWILYSARDFNSTGVPTGGSTANNPYRWLGYGEQIGATSNQTTTVGWNLTALGSFTTPIASPRIDSTGIYLIHNTSASANAIAGWQDNTGPAFTAFAAAGRLDLVIKSGTDISSQRLWAVLSSVAPSGSDTLNAIAAHGIGFRYSTNVGDTKWQAVAANGTSQTTVDTGITVVADTRYEMGIDFSNTGSVKYYINGALVATITTNLPTSATLLGGYILLTTLVNASRNVSIRKLQVASL